MNEPRSIKERLEQYVLAHPHDSFNVASIASVFGKEHLPAIERAIKDAQKRQGIQKPLLLKDSWKKGSFRLNPDYETLEQIRERANRHIEENPRVFESREQFDPKINPIQEGTHPSLPARKLHLRSILDRMKKNAAFSGPDVDFLIAETPHLQDALKEEKLS